MTEDCSPGRSGMSRPTVLIAGILGFLGVLIGAFAAHGLESFLAEQGIEATEIEKRIDQCDVAVRYHMLHTLAILTIGLASTPCRKRARVAVGAFLVGISLFSGGLYSMVFLGLMGHWSIVPAGGLFFLVGWLFVVCIALPEKSNS